MKKNLVIIGGGVILLLAFVPAVYFYYQYQRTQKLLINPSEVKKREVNSIIDQVGKLIDLPKEEEPTIATVSNKDRLKSQPFFSRAENGDKVLIYTKAKKAILYRPATNKIVEVGPVNIGKGLEATSSATAVSPAKPASVRVAIYNASKTVGLAASTEAKLKTKFNKINVVQKSNSQGDYEKNLVIDLSGRQKELVVDMAKFLGGEVGSFPLGELKPDTDILIIVVEL